MVCVSVSNHYRSIQVYELVSNHYRSRQVYELVYELVSNRSIQVCELVYGLVSNHVLLPTTFEFEEREREIEDNEHFNNM